VIDKELRTCAPLVPDPCDRKERGRLGRCWFVAHPTMDSVRPAIHVRMVLFRARGRFLLALLLVGCGRSGLDPYESIGGDTSLSDTGDLSDVNAVWESGIAVATESAPAEASGPALPAATSALDAGAFPDVRALMPARFRRAATLGRALAGAAKATAGARTSRASLAA
jgi:hypothetical protein